MLITIAVTWFGKGKQQLFQIKAPELTIYVEQGTLLFSYTEFSFKNEHTIVIIPNQEPLDTITIPYTHRSNWDLITTTTPLSRHVDGLPPKHWYIIDSATSPESITLQPPWPLPTDLALSALQKSVTTSNLLQNINHHVITLGHTRVLYCTFTQPFKDFSDAIKSFKEQFDLLVINSPDSEAIATLHSTIRPYFTVIIALPEAYHFHETNIIRISPTNNTPLVFTEDKNGMISLKEP